jgi:DnaD/phage-associated family protein
MDRLIGKFYKLGILSLGAFHEYMGEILAVDEKLQTILDELGVKRVVNYIDRENYKTWKDNWAISDELISYGVSLSKGKDSPLKYLSRVLADWHEKGIKTIKEAENTSPIPKIESTTKNNKNFSGRSYSSSEINALFQSIDEIDV